MTRGLTDLTLRGALDALEARDTSAEELARAHLDAIERLNPRLNAYVAVTGERALAQARASDERRARGEALGPLDGAPLGIKDLFCT
jgi:aspartyl-tRNA(Asn)/glutamyl-tRNA(Gln) amidotransferase subunit A